MMHEVDGLTDSELAMVMGSALAEWLGWPADACPGDPGDVPSWD
jgi:hypothetical protein